MGGRCEFSPGDFVMLERLTVSMLEADFQLTSTPRPLWDSVGSCVFAEEDVGFVLETCEVRSSFRNDEDDVIDHADVYARILTPSGVGWIHVGYLEIA